MIMHFSNYLAKIPFSGDSKNMVSGDRFLFYLMEDLYSLIKQVIPNQYEVKKYLYHVVLFLSVFFLKRPGNEKL
jgi:hypothetical protein